MTRAEETADAVKSEIAGMVRVLGREAIGVLWDNRDITANTEGDEVVFVVGGVRHKLVVTLMPETR